MCVSAVQYTTCGPPWTTSTANTHCCICEVNSMVWGFFSDPMMGLKEGRSERQEMKQVRNAREEGWGRSGKKVERKGIYVTCRYTHINYQHTVSVMQCVGSYDDVLQGA